MRLILLFLCCFSAIYSKAMPSDTITVWHLDFNGVKYLDVFPYNNWVEVNISKDTLSSESTFSIHQAAGCFWCEECMIYFAIYDQNQQLVQFVSGVNSNNDLTLSLKQLLAYNARTGERTLYYCQGEKPTFETIRHIVSITLVD